ncbi:MAG: hypothetical protein LBI14_07255 [Treponema sp.]|jgi:amidase|nr:hypothetical protein [Treponema sp.]
MPELFYSSVEEIHKLYKSKKLSVRKLVMAYLSRIAVIDSGTKGLKSVLELNPDALFIADVMDAKLQKGEELTPLFGIPVLVKDNINTADRLRTSAGSIALADNYAPCDAHIIKNLRKAGALILGKAGMTEFANYMTQNMPSGYSSRGGQVINPFNRKITPSGSSSGSAVATAAGLCTLSIGTETCGSIISPASYNGIVGIKPTLGLVGRSGIVPISSTLDTAGPMTRTVRDAAILLNVIAGYDPDDPATHANNPGQAGSANYTKYLVPDGLKGLKIGINRSLTQNVETLRKEEETAFNNECKLAVAAGAVLVDNVKIPSASAINKIMRYEFKACMNYYLSCLHGSAIKSLEDIIEYNQSHAALALKYGQTILLDCQNNTSGTMTEPEYLNALAEREKAIADLDKLFDENSIDILLCDAFSSIAPFTGFPSMTIPIGYRKNKVPIGSYWVARRFDEGTLIKATFAMEGLLGLS